MVNTVGEGILLTTKLYKKPKVAPILFPKKHKMEGKEYDYPEVNVGNLVKVSSNQEEIESNM